MALEGGEEAMKKERVEAAATSRNEMKDGRKPSRTKANNNQLAFDAHKPFGWVYVTDAHKPLHNPLSPMCKEVCSFLKVYTSQIFYVNIFLYDAFQNISNAWYIR